MANVFNAAVGLDFSLLKTQFHALYEMESETGYAILLAPTKHDSDNTVSINDIVNQINNMLKGKDGNQTNEISQSDIKNELASNLGSDANKTDVSFRLQTAYFYLDKRTGKDVLEYAFQLEVITDVIPDAVKDLIDVSDVTISIWNTERRSVIDKMNLITIDEYLGISEKTDTKLTAD